MSTPKPTPTIQPDEFLLHSGETEYALMQGFKIDDSGRPLILKTPVMMARYLELLAKVDPERILEIGVFNGTSTAAIAEICTRAKLVALELNPVPPAFLIDFIEQTGREASLRPYFGVDQSDTARIREIVAAEFGDEPLDLVIDDASHRLDPTRTSFEVLFPRLRPGGVYVIEDWELNQRFGPDPRPQNELVDDPDAAGEASEAEKQLQTLLAEPPLIRLNLELLVAAAASNDYVAELHVGECMFEVVRGPAPLDPDTFRVEDLYDDHLGILPR